MSQTALITGCSSGFGLATAQLLASRGWNVIASMRQPADSCLEEQENILITRLDVQDRHSIDAAITAGLQRFGTIDAVINNAGWGINAVFEEVPRKSIQEIFDVNLFGVMDVTRAILPQFRANRKGTILNVSSGVGVFGLPLATLYNASKFALEGFSESLSYELEGLGIRVKIVEPGAVPDTEFSRKSRARSAEYAVIEDYNHFREEIALLYQGFRSRADADAVIKVAAGIFDALTDDSNQLRYVLTDDIKPFINARRSSTEEEYMTFMRSVFTPGKAS
ncbi:SDR family oxidoreductase [Pantoea cypripedii]|uniref:Short-chain dehydrogenase/reductase n=1 Tax=Pantoea cypripedii TaxID=55209 RepID=A0A6B9GFH5_PANCY|nr:SDR family oxidoreductase [Pantoea cypripedii]QGY32449.1 short-chain dehydrogenase/reductase [Pantoea cypripedii]